jgi:hypothetical protein
MIAFLACQTAQTALFTTNHNGDWITIVHVGICVNRFDISPNNPNTPFSQPIDPTG